MGMGQNRYLGPIDGGDVGRGDNFFWTASGKDLALAQQDEFMAELGRQVEVVENGKHSQTLFVHQAADQGEYLQLVIDVQVKGRLVQ
jgi:hypothetical protein